MRKILAILTALLVVATPSIAEEAVTPEVVVEDVQIEMRGFDEITLPVGTFVPVMTTQEISTETCPEGYKVKFIAFAS